ncbi:MAG: SDR family oxidoreductase [Anaerolineaceae bacterium]|nr:SDR family oxidoreductase [Anaerolineaceae bacterium]
MGILDNKVAVITGSSRGLGLGIAERYAAEGAAVIITSRSEKSVERAVNTLKQQGAKVAGIACDVGDLDSVKKLRDFTLDTFGSLDIWVNNAGLSGPYGPTADLSIESYEQVLDTNIYGTYYGSVIAVRHFVAQGSGKLINLLGRGDKGPVKYQNAYAPSKIWVRSFTLALAQEYADSGVGIFAFNPGLVETDMTQQVAAIQGYEAKLNPLRTIRRMWGNPPEVPAEKALWLASAATDGKTGIEVQVLDFPRVVRGALGEGLLRLTGKHNTVPLQIEVIPPAVP